MEYLKMMNKRVFCLGLLALSLNVSASPIELTQIYDATKPLAYIDDVILKKDGEGLHIVQGLARIGTSVSETTYCFNDSDKLVDCKLEPYKIKKNYCIEAVSEVASTIEVSKSGITFLKPLVKAQTREVDCSLYKTTSTTKK